MIRHREKKGRKQKNSTKKRVKRIVSLFFLLAAVLAAFVIVRPVWAQSNR